jgi:hypothetical protein
VHFFAAMRSAIVSAVVVIAAACSTPAVGAPVPGGASPDAGTDSGAASLGDTLHIQLGRTASVDGGRLVLTFVSRGTDSRCPANVVCVWMGDVSVRIAARTGKTSVDRELHTGIEPHSLTVNGYVVMLVGLLPYPGTAAPEAPPPATTVLLYVTRP